MTKPISEIKKQAEQKILELRIRRKGIVSDFKKKLEDIKIEKIRNDILGK